MLYKKGVLTELQRRDWLFTMHDHFATALCFVWDPAFIALTALFSPGVQLRAPFIKKYGMHIM